MDFETWWDTFKPQANHINPMSSGPMVTVGDDSAGRAFNVRGQEGDYVRMIAETEPGRVWSLLECDGMQTITNGFRVVNLESYYVTEKPFNGEFIEINIDDDFELTEKYEVLVNGKNVFNGQFDSLDDATIGSIMFSLHHMHEVDKPLVISRKLYDGDANVSNDEEVVSTVFNAYAELADNSLGLCDICWSISSNNSETTDSYLDWLKKQVYVKFKETGLAPVDLHISFLDSVKLGIADASSIDNWVESWHRGEFIPSIETRKDVSLALYLGLSNDEYENFIKDPDFLSSMFESSSAGSSKKSKLKNKM